LGFNESPPKHDLQISKLQQINLDEDKEPELNKKRINSHQIFNNDFDRSFKNNNNSSYLTCNDLTINVNFENDSSILYEKKKEKNTNKLSEINDAQKFYAESLMKIKKSNQDLIFSPKNRFSTSAIRKKKQDYKENIYEE